MDTEIWNNQSESQESRSYKKDDKLISAERISTSAKTLICGAVSLNAEEYAGDRTECTEEHVRIVSQIEELEEPLSKLVSEEPILQSEVFEEAPCLLEIERQPEDPLTIARPEEPTEKFDLAAECADLPQATTLLSIPTVQMLPELLPAPLTKEVGPTFAEPAWPP